jgi:hypothetical protein
MARQKSRFLQMPIEPFTVEPSLTADCVYDTHASEEEFISNDSWIADGQAVPSLPFEDMNEPAV